MRDCKCFILILVILALIGLSSASVGASSSQDDLLVVRVFYRSEDHLRKLVLQLDVWEVQPDEDYLVAMVSEDQLLFLMNAGYRVEIDQDLTNSVQESGEIDPAQRSGILNYPCYRTVEETYTSAENLVKAYPHLATWIDIGDSWEKVESNGISGYDLMVLTLTNKLVGGNKPKLFINAAIHPREYAPAELATRFAEYLVENYGVDPDITWILDNHEIHLLLQANPDGRKLAEDGKLQRKNTNHSFCPSGWFGADLNRNFDFQWGNASINPCDQTYQGPTAASEPETQAIQNYLTALFPDQRGNGILDPVPLDATGIFLDIHSYGNAILWSWGFTGDYSAPNHLQLQTLGRKLAFFNNYSAEQAGLSYPGSGAADDYTYGTLGVAAYTIEIGTALFQNCKSFESGIVPDMLPALLYAARVARAPFKLPSGPEVLNLSVSSDSVLKGEVVEVFATLDDTRFSTSDGMEPIQLISGGILSVDFPLWEMGGVPIQMEPVDNQYDTSVEGVSTELATPDWTAGRHMIYVQGQDSEGNWGPIKSIFINIMEDSLYLPIFNY